MLLSNVEALKYKNDALRTCPWVSLMYVIGNHKLCLLELLYKGNKREIQRNCQTEMLTNMVLP